MSFAFFYQIQMGKVKIAAVHTASSGRQGGKDSPTGDTTRE
jgi:hypothetical protein